MRLEIGINEHNENKEKQTEEKELKMKCSSLRQTTSGRADNRERNR